MIIFILFNIFFIIICYQDIKSKIIDEKYILVLFIISIIDMILKNSYYNSYISAAFLSFPFFLLSISEYYLKKEVIGLGDLKIFIILGLYLKIIDVLDVFRLILYIYSCTLVYIVIFKLKKGYIAFCPFIYLGFIIFKGVEFYGK